MRKSEILKYGQYAAAAVTVSDEGVQAEDGVKIVKAGTIVGGAGGKRLEDASLMVEESNDGGAEGVLLYDVDVTGGPAEGSMVIFGFVNLESLPEAPTDEAAEAMKMVRFLV